MEELRVPHRLREMLLTMTAEEVARVEKMDEATRAVFVARCGRAEAPVPPQQGAPVLIACEHCSRQCGSKLLLQHHIRAQHPEAAEYRCKMCSRAYQSRNGLRKHVKKNHQ